MVKISKRVRNYPQGFSERQAARDRLPGWAKLAQFAIWIPAWLLTTALWFALFSEARHLLRPADSFLEIRTFGEKVTALAALFGTIPLGFMLTNLALWFIAPLRRANERAAGGTPGMTFKDATEDLVSTAYVIVPAGALASLIGLWF